MDTAGKKLDRSHRLPLKCNASSWLSRIRVGLAGWSNPPTVQADRPPGHSHLAYYANYFSCVEINSSFYRPHRGATYARWRDETPPHFRFSVKMPRCITHESDLKRCGAEVSRFYEAIALLQPKLAAVLVQLPPSLEFNAASVRSFFKAVPRLRSIQVTCEPRHASWFSRPADEMLRRLGVSRVAADPARCAGSDVPGGGRRMAYFRWHGAPRVYYSKYSDAQLLDFASRVKLAGANDTWCIFDNTARYAAWDDARRFIDLIRGRSLATGCPLQARTAARRINRDKGWAGAR